MPTYYYDVDVLKQFIAEEIENSTTGTGDESESKEFGGWS